MEHSYHIQDSSSSAARERVLNVAETLFRERGYAAVSLSDLADALGMRKASLYHHAPGGKEALFVEVMERTLRRYRAGLEGAIRNGGATFLEKLHAAAYWLLEHPSLHYGRMMQSDMEAIRPENAHRLRAATHSALLVPLQEVFLPEMERRGVDVTRVQYLTGAFLAIVESIHNLPGNFSDTPKTEMSDFVIDMLFRNFGKTLPNELTDETGE
jgi:TetR/AcrR family transcriptional regulator, cholesterol catabolism regulator